MGSLPYGVFLAGQEKLTDAAMHHINLANNQVAWNVWRGRPGLDYSSWRGIIEDSILVHPMLRDHLKQVHLHHHVYSTHVPMLVDMDWPPVKHQQVTNLVPLYFLMGFVFMLVMASLLAWWGYERSKRGTLELKGQN